MVHGRPHGHMLGRIALEQFAHGMSLRRQLAASRLHRQPASFAFGLTLCAVERQRAPRVRGRIVAMQLREIDKQFPRVGVGRAVALFALALVADLRCSLPRPALAVTHRDAGN